MWMMTPRGFYSAVQKSGDLPDRVTVRARTRGDLENLRDILPDAKPYQEKFFTDYPWRINVPVSEWARACAVMALEIDYSNFKDEVARKQGASRASVYGRIWSTLLALEDRAKGRGKGWRDDYLGYDYLGYDVAEEHPDDFSWASGNQLRGRTDEQARLERDAIARGKRGGGRGARRSSGKRRRK